MKRPASALVERTDIDELSAKERLDLALKVMQQLHRFVTLGQQLEALAQPTNHFAGYAYQSDAPDARRTINDVWV